MAQDANGDPLTLRRPVPVQPPAILRWQHPLQEYLKKLISPQTIYLLIGLNSGKKDQGLLENTGIGTMYRFNLWNLYRLGPNVCVHHIRPS